MRSVGRVPPFRSDQKVFAESAYLGLELGLHIKSLAEGRLAFDSAPGNLTASNFCGAIPRLRVRCRSHTAALCWPKIHAQAFSFLLLPPLRSYCMNEGGEDSAGEIVRQHTHSHPRVQLLDHKVYLKFE